MICQASHAPAASPRKGRRRFKLAWVDEFYQSKIDCGGTKHNSQTARRCILKVLAAAVAEPLAPASTKTDLAAAVDRYIRTLQEADRNEIHVRDTRRNILALLELSGWSLATDAIEAEGICSNHLRSWKSFTNWMAADASAGATPSNLDNDAIKRGLMRMRETEWSVGTCRLALTFIKEFCCWASHPDRRYLDRDPSQHISYDLLNGEIARDRIAFTEQDIGRLLDKAAASNLTLREIGGADRAIIYHAIACTGLRPHHLHELVVGDFTLNVERPHVKVGDRDVPILPASARERLLAHFNGKGEKDRAFHPKLIIERETRDNCYLSQMLIEDLKAVGIKPFRAEGRRRLDVLDCESLRFTYGVRASKAGATIAEIQHWLGHKHATGTRAFLAKGLTEGQVAEMSRRAQRPAAPVLATVNPAQAPQRPKGKRGRPLGEGEEERRCRLLERYDDAKAKEISQKDFCEDEGVSVADLDAIVNWRTKRNDRKRSGKNRADFT